MRGRNAKKDGCGQLYVRDVTGVSKKQVEFCGRYNITFCPERRNALSRSTSPSMSTEHIQAYYKETKKELMGFRDNGNVRVENSDGKVQSFVSFNQLLSDKTVTTPKSTALVAYPCLPFFRMCMLEKEDIW